MIIGPRRWPAAAMTISRTYGARGLMLRSAHEFRRRVGGFRAHPRYSCPTTTSWMDHPFAVDGARLRESTDDAVAIERAERVVLGEYQAFRWQWRPFPSTGSEWLGGENDSATPKVWWKIDHFDVGRGDIKAVWEPARFAWVYDLIRGWLLTRDERYVRAFAERFTQWYASSPPYSGTHWSCGQETAIRAFALLYAEANFGEALNADREVDHRIVTTLAASGERIADAIGYAVSQRNNHGISEAAGLLVCGLRLRDIHPEARNWIARGKSLLERLIVEQIADDGWYIQHSFNYLRLALDQCVIADRSLRHAGMRFGTAATDRLRAAVRLLLAVVDPATGVVPNHGHNDGAFVHPITLAGFRDYRPVITAACATFDVPLPANVAADREVLAWLGRSAPRSSASIGDGVVRGTSGWAVARVADVFVFLRAGRYTSRPAHVDPLHIDVRVAGREIVVDAGTYAYHAPPPWRNGLVGADVHNGPVVDGQASGVRGPRFLWLLWPDALLESAEPVDRGVRLAASIPGRVRRTVLVTPDRVSIDDQALGDRGGRIVVRWLLHPAVPASILESNTPARVRAAAEGDVAGWFSPYYGCREAAHVVALESERGVPLRCSLPVARIRELSK